MVIVKVIALRMLPQRFSSLVAGCVMAAFQNSSAEETIDLFNSEEFVHMLECLANLDQCSTEGEFDNRIPEILKALCNVSQADRAYVFEWDDEEKATLSNTFEYCAPGVTPEIENLQCIPTENMPIWVDTLVADSPMIIPDLEAVANEMPREYAILKPQNIHSLAVFPAFAGHKLVGFIGVDNPSPNVNTPLYAQLLRSLGGHIGNVRQTLRTLAQLEIDYEVISAIGKIYRSIYRVDIDSNYFEALSVSPEMEEVFGEEGDAVKAVSEKAELWVSDESLPMMREFMDVGTLAERLQNTDTISTEYLTRTGQWNLARFIVKKRNSEGRVTNALYCVRRITDQKLKEIEYQRELEAATSEAQRANIAKTDFLRRMSHDVRTPINGIRGMLEIGDHFPNDMEKQAECRKKAWDASTYLLSLINNVLDMNKLESGEMLLEQRSFNLRQMMDDITNVVSTQGAAYGITLAQDESDLNVDHWDVIGSPQHLRQVITNLASNAVKYNRKGGKVVLRTEELSCGNGEAKYRFICADTGIGISDEFKPHVFETFAQEGRPEALDVADGTGLGLAIVKNLVQQMGGNIEFESKEGEGTVFTVDLPLRIDVSKHETFHEKVAVNQTFEGMQILLVEDNDLNAEIAEFILSQHGVEVERAVNGKEAVRMFNEAAPGRYDLIFMDIMMPEMDGLEATRSIRALVRPDAKQIPIYAMSANAFVDDAIRSQEAGMNGHLSKPLEEDRIVEVLASAYSERK